ncbi:hypothetical protein QBC40DRAFT_278562 [Triangularia verruculosa]|uniref:Pentatricopeptide repeat-containing protein n=1 Tax=Triangularia verruculosa TaxID=2587418 RepID=A0AAN6XKL1_9PEZI|nr:hypothetical protein QBC40DRAFT_278562 [Triangularia verruculosa]
MPPRTFSLDLGRTGNYVCKSCLAHLRPGNSQPPPWLARQASTARSLRSRTRKPATGLKEKDPDPAEIQRMLAEDLFNGSNAKSNLDIKYYSENIATGERKTLQTNDEFGEESTGLDHEVLSSIEDLEKRMLDTLKMINVVEREGKKEKAAQLRRQFKTAIRTQYKGKTGLGGEAFGVLRISGFPSRWRAVEELNIFLARDNVVRGGIPSRRDLAECWKYYSSARKLLSTNWKAVPREVWDFLFLVLSFESRDNPNRMQHIYVLTKDMQAANVPMSDMQQLLAMEAMFIEGWEAEAIDAWKRAVVTLGSNQETFKPYYELGVRMCALHGDTERAQHAADTLLRSSHASDARIIIPVVRALAAKESMLGEAWERYRDMRMLLGGSMTLQDYDEIIGAFLAVGAVEQALQVFVDMMFSDAIDIRGRTRLPMMVGNHFFTGKWLKRLIGEGDLDGAYKVVVFLQSKGIISSPVQVNGLIAAWMRSGSAENLEKADKLAWQMIQARLDFVQLRQRQSIMTHKLEDSLRLFNTFGEPYAKDEQQGDEAEFRCQARATAETFSLLAENYCSRRLHARLQELFTILDQAEIGPTAFLMNQLIRSYSQANETKKARNMYNKMTQVLGIKPDGHTFLIMFNTLSVNRLVQRVQNLTEQDVTTARTFFKDMVEAKWEFDGPELFGKLPRTILFSMFKAKDWIGSIVACRAMRHIFGFHPTDALLVELASGIGTLQVKTKQNTIRLTHGSRIIERTKHGYRKELIERGHPGEEMTPEELVEENHAVFEQIVFMKAKVHQVVVKDLNRWIEEVSKEMGVYDIVVRGDEKAISECMKLDRQALMHGMGSE